ncbi:hypothetical protein Acr_11g0007220 [Actinidia rufa]|uniref:Uncharacterized protein n=1 Tax=Actinidia rufa TaxID=165716 RepID=A0A7J0FDA9_9ERIC|nr:hypothetical protein Acr_11g0007220 [Actinidia rufa]
MHSRSEVGDLGNLEDSLPSWITTHLGEGSSSFMTDEVTQSPDSPREDPPSPKDVPMVVVSPQPRLAVLRGKVQEDLARRIPNNVKGKKRKFLFTSGEDWEFFEGSSRCNNPRKLYWDEVTRVEHIFNSVEEKGLYSIPALLESKPFCRVVGSCQPMAFGKENKGEDRPTDDVPTSLGDVGESPHS